MKSNTTFACGDERFFLSDLLIRIRRESVRPVESSSDAMFSTTLDATSETERDCEEIRTRAAAEGLAFFTKALPELGKAFDRALLGQGGSFVATSFRKRSDEVLPEFLRYFSNRVFDASGSVRDNACTQSVKALRQLTLAFYKLNVPYEDKLKNKILDSFLQVDSSLPVSFSGFPRALGAGFPESVHRLKCLPSGSTQYLCPELGLAIQTARYIIGSVLGDVNPRDIRPCHGPGAVSTGEKVSEKSHFSLMYDRLERVYPFQEYMRFNLTHVSDTCDELPRYEESGTAKVVLVPKDSRGPRLISCEPLSNQWIQQGQLRSLVEAMERHPLTRGHVNFRDQSVNGSLALQSSLTREYATLDMKDASDRVSWALIELLFPLHWIEALWASRSSHTKLPKGELVHLKKFAPMGSAVCFPVEALCFYALAVGAVYSKRVRRSAGSGAISYTGLLNSYDRRAIRAVAKTIYVYGDDLICRTEDSGSVIAYLECFALRFNTDKCCRTGFFRESCGVDAFKGVDVTPVRFRTRPGTSQLTPQALVSWVEYSNRLYERGFVDVANTIQDYVASFIYIPTQMVGKDQLYTRLGGVMYIRPYPGPSIPIKGRRRARDMELGTTRWNRRFQRREMLVLKIVPAKERENATGWEQMLRAESKKQLNSPLSLALELAFGSTRGVHAVPRRYKLKRGWVWVP